MDLQREIVSKEEVAAAQKTEQRKSEESSLKKMKYTKRKGFNLPLKTVSSQALPVTLSF